MLVFASYSLASSLLQALCKPIHLHLHTGLPPCSHHLSSWPHSLKPLLQACFCTACVLMLQPVGRTCNRVLPTGPQVGSCWWIFELPNRQRHPHRRVQPAFVDARAGLIDLVDEFLALPKRHSWASATLHLQTAPAGHSSFMPLGSTSDYLIAASHNHEEASSPRLSMPNYNRMKIFDPPLSSLICSFVSSSAVSTPLYLSFG